MTEEEKNKIFKYIQEIVNNNPVLVIGCGASMDYNIPGMGQLGEKITEYFIKNPPKAEASKSCIEKLKELLASGLGLEDAMLSITCTDEVEDHILHIVWDAIAPKDNEVLTHIMEKKLHLPITDLFQYLIYGRPKALINIVTTNYDRLIEYAASQTNAYVNCGCSQSHIGRFIGFNNINQYVQLKDFEGCVNILKIHGSLDWFVDDDGYMTCYPNTRVIPAGMKPCIITPGTNKYRQALKDPHRSLLSSVDELFRNASAYMCIGYGFNDQHIQPKLLQTAALRRKKILIVTKELTDKIRSEVIEKGLNYIIVYSDGNRGTKFQVSDNTYIDTTTEYWRLKNFMEIIK